MQVTSHNQESTQTTLKYAIEVEVPQSNALLGVMDPLLERIVYQDIPANLSSVKDRVAQLRQGVLHASLLCDVLPRILSNNILVAREKGFQCKA